MPGCPSGAASFRFSLLHPLVPPAQRRDVRRAQLEQQYQQRVALAPGPRGPMGPGEQLPLLGRAIVSQPHQPRCRRVVFCYACLHCGVPCRCGLTHVRFLHC